MPFGGLLSLGGAAASLGGGLAGLFGGGGSGSVNMPQQIPISNIPQTQGAVWDTTQGLGQYNVPAQLLPQYQQIAQQSVSNPYASMYQQGANQAGGMDMNAAGGAYNLGGALTGTAQGGLPDVQSLLAMGFDPQGALYARTEQQLTDQVRAGEAARGIQTTPYGAGVENSALSNFNIDWQNQQLQRAVQGAQGAGQFGSALASLGNTGANLQAGAGGLYAQGAGLPYSTLQGINANALGTLGQTGQFGTSASQIPQQQITDYLGYLNYGNNAQNSNISLANAGVNQANSVFNQNQTLGGNIGSGLAGLNRAGQGWGGGGGWYGTAPSAYNPGMAGALY